MIDHLLQSCVHFAHTFISFSQTYFEVLVRTTAMAAVDTFTGFAITDTIVLEASDKNRIVRKLEFTRVIIANSLVENYFKDRLEFTWAIVIFSAVMDPDHSHHLCSMSYLLQVHDVLSYLFSYALSSCARSFINLNFRI